MDIDYNSLSEEEQIDIVSKNGNYIKYINNPCLEVQLAAVMQYGVSIKYINNPCLEVQLVAVNENGHCIILIKDPGYEVQLSAIQNNLNINKNYFEFIKPYITYPDLLELLEIKILACEE